MYNLQWCVCVIPCFATAVLLLFAADSDELIFLLFDSLSKTVSIAPFFDNTLTLLTPNTPKDSASLLSGWKQLSSKCLLYKLKWSSSVGSYLSPVGFTWSAHFLLSRGFLEKPYSPSLQVELQPIDLPYCLGNSKTTHSSITLHMLYHTHTLSTWVAVVLVCHS